MSYTFTTITNINQNKNNEIEEEEPIIYSDEYIEAQTALYINNDVYNNVDYLESDDEEEEEQIYNNNNNNSDDEEEQIYNNDSGDDEITMINNVSNIIINENTKLFYKEIENNNIFNCNICFNDYTTNYFKCNTCNFNMCSECEIYIKTRYNQCVVCKQC